MRSLAFVLVASAPSALAFCPPPGPILAPPTLQNGPSQPLIPASSFESLVYNADTSYAIKAKIGGTEIFNYDYTAPPYADASRVELYETKVRIASVTKLFTVLSVILSADKIGWEDSINKYVTELQGDVWNEVTISALASQTSGLGRFVRTPLKLLKETLSNGKSGICRRSCSDPKLQTRTIRNSSREQHITWV